MVIQEFIENKYGSDSPGSDRFKKERGEVHASQVSNCQRKHYWNHRQPKATDPSIYFELGRMYERMYGRALASVYGEDMVIQDVGVEIHIHDDLKIVGESDWCILREPFEGENLKYVLETDGTRREIREYGSRQEGHVIDEDTEPLVEEVLETKTTRKIKWKRVYGYDESHEYQLSVYMMAMDVPGKIVYMERNDATEWEFEFDRDENMDMDIRIRAQQHYRNLGSDEVPSTSPVSEKECKYCDHQAECKKLGGSKWL